MPLDGVTLNNVTITADNGFNIRNAKNIVFNQVKITSTEGQPLTTKNTQLTNNP
jgi:hypothetical protein